MDIVDRLVKFRDYTGLSNSQFADQALIPRPTLSQFLNGRNKRLSDEFIAKLHAAYPNLDVMWLLFGEGDMLSDENIKISESSQVQNSPISSPQKHENKEVAPPSIVDNHSAQQQTIYTTAEQNMVESPINHTFDASGGGILTVAADSGKAIRSIMVFYSDNSYETFVPQGRK